MPMNDGLLKCRNRAMKISGTDSKGGYMKEDMTDEKGMHEDEKGMYEEKGSTAGCKCPGCMNCKKMGGCTKDMCVGHKEYYDSKKDEEKTMEFAEFELLKEQLNSLRVVLD